MTTDIEDAESEEAASADPERNSYGGEDFDNFSESEFQDDFEEASEEADDGDKSEDEKQHDGGEDPQKQDDFEKASEEADDGDKSEDEKQHDGGEDPQKQEKDEDESYDDEYAHEDEAQDEKADVRPTQEALPWPSSTSGGHVSSSSFQRDVAVEAARLCVCHVVSVASERVSQLVEEQRAASWKEEREAVQAIVCASLAELYRETIAHVVDRQMQLQDGHDNNSDVGDAFMDEAGQAIACLVGHAVSESSEPEAEIAFVDSPDGGANQLVGQLDDGVVDTSASEQKDEDLQQRLEDEENEEALAFVDEPEGGANHLVGQLDDGVVDTSASDQKDEDVQQRLEDEENEEALAFVDEPEGGASQLVGQLDDGVLDTSAKKQKDEDVQQKLEDEEKEEDLEEGHKPPQDFEGMPASEVVPVVPTTDGCESVMRSGAGSPDPPPLDFAPLEAAAARFCPTDVPDAHSCDNTEEQGHTLQAAREADICIVAEASAPADAQRPQTRRRSGEVQWDETVEAMGSPDAQALGTPGHTENGMSALQVDTVPPLPLDEFRGGPSVRDAATQCQGLDHDDSDGAFLSRARAVASKTAVVCRFVKDREVQTDAGQRADASSDQAGGGDASTPMSGSSPIPQATTRSITAPRAGMRGGRTYMPSKSWQPPPMQGLSSNAVADEDAVPPFAPQGFKGGEAQCPLPMSTTQMKRFYDPAIRLAKDIPRRPGCESKHRAVAKQPGSSVHQALQQSLDTVGSASPQQQALRPPWHGQVSREDSSSARRAMKAPASTLPGRGLAQYEGSPFKKNSTKLPWIEAASSDSVQEGYFDFSVDRPGGPSASKLAALPSAGVPSGQKASGRRGNKDLPGVRIYGSYDYNYVFSLK